MYVRVGNFFRIPHHFSLIFDRIPSCGCGSVASCGATAVAAAVKGETAGILEKSHKVNKNWKMGGHGVKKPKLFHRRED